MRRVPVARSRPKDFVVPVRVERRIDVDEIYTRIREFLQLLQIVAAVDDARVDDGRGSARRSGIARRNFDGFFWLTFAGGLACVLARHGGS